MGAHFQVRHMSPSPLESAILAWISSRKPSLFSRLATAEITRRDYTGVGFYVYLTPDTGQEWDRPPVEGPVIASRQLNEGGGSILWLSRGEPCCVEIYAFGDVFPEYLEDFELSGSDGRA